MSFIKNIVDNPHPIFNNYCAYWNFLLMSYEGGVDYAMAHVPNGKTFGNDTGITYTVNGKVPEYTNNMNLFKHPRELTEDYERRIRMSYYYNFCSPIIDIYTNHLFKATVIEEFGSIETTLEYRKENVDLKGSSLTEFRKELAESVQIYGHSFVIVDSPRVDGVILTKEDQILNDAFQYLTIYPPQAVINWSLDAFGRPYWVLIKEMIDSNADPFNYDKKAKAQCLYRLWTRDSWYLYDGDFNLIMEDMHGLGEVPIVCVYDKKSKKQRSFLGISSLADIAFIARDIYNACAELKQILRDQTFALLTVQGRASDYNQSSVGTNNALVYPEERNAPAYLSPPPTNAQVYFDHIDRQVSKIYQLAKLEGGSASFGGQSAVEQSGVSKAWDFNETNAALSEKASNLEDAELRIWQLFAKWEGKEFDGRIQYPNEFSVSSLMQDLDEAEKISKLNLGATFNKEVKKAIQKKKFPRATDDELDQMEQELEQSTQTESQKLLGRFGIFRQDANQAVKQGGTNVEDMVNGRDRQFGDGINSKDTAQQ